MDFSLGFEKLVYRCRRPFLSSLFLVTTAWEEDATRAAVFGRWLSVTTGERVKGEGGERDKEGE